MQLTDDTLTAASRALERGYSFALMCKGNDASVFVCDDNSGRTPRSQQRFFVSPWPCRSVTFINDAVSAGELLQLPPAASKAPLPEPWPTSTDKSQYLQKVGALVEELRHTGGKTVISRTLCGELSIPVTEAFARLCRANPEAVCCLMFTHEHGCWLTATPELLLSADGTQLHTMSLAGTRRADATADWDDKNIAEQRMVTDWIMGRLADVGLQPCAQPVTTVCTSTVQHLCTPITARKNSATEALDVCLALAPTPAVCGAPQALAIERIAKIESHQRRLYSGFFGIAHTPGNMEAYVTLRCAQLSHSEYCIYAGGGITAMSVPADEWTETALKAKSLLQILCHSKNLQTA